MAVVVVVNVSGVSFVVRGLNLSFCFLYKVRHKHGCLAKERKKVTKVLEFRNLRQYLISKLYQAQSKKRIFLYWRFIVIFLIMSPQPKVGDILFFGADPISVCAASFRRDIF